jgi:gluconokinase
MMVAQTEDASAVGAALMAMKSEGLIKEYPDAAFADARLFKPNPVNAKLYEKNFTIFKQLYDNLKQTMHKLNELNS